MQSKLAGIGFSFVATTLVLLLCSTGYLSYSSLIAPSELVIPVFSSVEVTNLTWKFCNTTVSAEIAASEGANALQKKIFLNPVILAWTTHLDFDSRPIAQLYNEKQTACRCQCVITDDRSKIDIAGAVLFFGRRLKKEDFPKKRFADQLFTFLVNEAPPVTLTDLSMFPPNFFNITMTYRLDSDVQWVYDKFERIDSTTTPNMTYSWNEVEEAISRKTKSVLQLISHCTTYSKREAYISELAKYVNISQYGYCSSNKCDEQCEAKEAASHHFILALENNVCRDYITEKFFRVKKYLIVPIVAKDEIVRYIMPEHSYIAADNFESPEALAAYLRFLEGNHTEYIKYFGWTKYYKKTKRQPIVCDLCALLHRGLNKRRMVENIYRWWVEDSECEEGYAKKLLEKHDNIFLD